MNVTWPENKETVNAKRNTICWHCTKACGGCSWSDDLKPVDGWDVIETKINCIGKGYIVVNCPEYVEKKNRSDGRPESFDPDGCEKLVQRLAATAADDYVKFPEMRGAIKRWFRGKLFANLSGGVDPEYIIEGLNEMAKEHDDDLEKRLRRSYNP